MVSTSFSIATTIPLQIIGRDRWPHR